MEKYQSLNVLSQKKLKDYMSDDAIQDVANMIKATGANRSQRKRLERSLRKTQNIMSHAQKHLDRSSVKQFEEGLEDTMRRFYSVLGIVLKTQYGYEETEEKTEISDVFEVLNSYLEEYRELSTDDVAKICFETTGIELIAMK